MVGWIRGGMGMWGGMEGERMVLVEWGVRIAVWVLGDIPLLRRVQRRWEKSVGVENILPPPQYGGFGSGAGGEESMGSTWRMECAMLVNLPLGDLKRNGTMREGSLDWRSMSRDVSGISRGW